METQHDFTCSKPWLQRIVKIWTAKHITFLSNLGRASWEASDISFQRGVFNFNIKSTPAVWIRIGKSPWQSPRKPFHSARWWLAWEGRKRRPSKWIQTHLFATFTFLCHLNYQSIWRLNGRQAISNAVVSKQQSLPDNSKNEWYDKAPHAQMPQKSMFLQRLEHDLLQETAANLRKVLGSTSYECGDLPGMTATLDMCLMCPPSRLWPTSKMSKLRAPVLLRALERCRAARDLDWWLANESSGIEESSVARLTFRTYYAILIICTL